MHLLLQAGDTDLEELVDVLAQDRQEAHPLEERKRLVLRHGQHPLVEVELGDLAVDVMRLGGGRGLLDRRLRKDGHIVNCRRRNRRNLPDSDVGTAWTAEDATDWSGRSPTRP